MNYVDVYAWQYRLAEYTHWLKCISVMNFAEINSIIKSVWSPIQDMCQQMYCSQSAQAV